MPHRILVLGATGALGHHVARQAAQAGHDVSVVVRDPSRLPPDLVADLTVHRADLTLLPPTALATLAADRDVVLTAAGHVADGEAFVSIVDRVASALELLPRLAAPVAWFVGGAAVLDLDARGRRALDLPGVATTYWPHGANHARLRRSTLDWRLLCPGPMVEGPPLGLTRLRIGVDRVPVAVPRMLAALPGALALPFFLRRVPELIVPYADAAALMLAHATPDGPMSRRRIGVALPAGMRGRKPRWAPRARAS